MQLGFDTTSLYLLTFLWTVSDTMYSLCVLVGFDKF